MAADFGYIESFLLLAIPWFGSYPGIARAVATPPASRWIIASFAVVASLALMLRGAGWIALPRTIVLCSFVYQAVVLTLLYRRFTHTHRREPVDAAFNFDTGILPDRVFAFANVGLGLIPPLTILFWAV